MTALPELRSCIRSPFMFGAILLRKAHHDEPSEPVLPESFFRISLVCVNDKVALHNLFISLRCVLEEGPAN